MEPGRGEGMKPLDLSGGRETCSFCPKLCRHACPAAEAEGSEQATPTFKQQVALQAAEGLRALDLERARVLYKCTDCAGTAAACRHQVPVGDSLQAARAAAVAAGFAPPEVGGLAARFAATGSPYSMDLSSRAQGGRPKRGVVGVMPACTTLAHDPAGLPRIMTLLGLTTLETTTALPDPPCCGYPLLAAGLVDAFRAHAARVAASLAGFERIAVEGAGCAHTLLRRYPEHGVRLGPQILPLADLFAAHAERLEELAPAAPAARPYAYHDPCALGRKLGRVDEPRRALSAVYGRPPLELGERGEHTRCSGGGGVYPLTHPEEARRCGERVAELCREAGGEVLVTGCPSAARRLRLAAPDLEVLSLDEALGARLLEQDER